MTEGRLSSLLRRAAGFVWLPAIPIAWLTLGTFAAVATAAITIACLPTFMFVVHLNFTRVLQDWEKDVWRLESWPTRGWFRWSRSYREHYAALITAWTYVRAADLKAATEALPSYQRRNLNAFRIQ